MHLKSWLEI